MVLIYIAALLFFVYLAARRRMGSDRIHPLSKVQAIAGMLTLSILLVGGIWKQDSYDVLAGRRALLSGGRVDLRDADGDSDPG